MSATDQAAADAVGATLAVNTAVFAWEWARALVGTSWVPDDRTVIADRLRKLTERASAVILADGPSAHVGREIGAGVVAIGFAAPEALGRTLELLAGRLLDDLGVEPTEVEPRRRLPALLGAVGVGFSRAARNRILAAQDAIRSSDLIARQRVEQAFRAQVARQEAAGMADVPTGSAPVVGRTGRPVDTGYHAEFPAALDRGEVVAYYQPIVELGAAECHATVVGFEALARWEHPDRGVLPPASFLPVAAQAGLLPALGRRLREDACAEAARWQSEAGRPVFVGVNLAPAELRDPGLVEDVRAVLDRTGLAPGQLHLEITEDASLSDLDLPVLRGLATAGVQLTLDDFGTGCARLALLSSLPVHGLKLASALLDPVRQLPFEAAQQGAEVLDAVTSLANRLGLVTTVEGVETPAEAGLARRLGIARAQGWHYGRPTPGEGVWALLS